MSMVGPHVTELINEVALLQFMNGSTLELGLTTHAHPSLSEILMELGLKAKTERSTFKGGSKMIDYKSVGLTDEDLREIYKWMDLGRKLDERLWLLNRGKIPFVVSGQDKKPLKLVWRMQ